MFNFLSSRAGSMLQGVTSKFKLESDDEEESEEPKVKQTPTSPSTTKSVGGDTPAKSEIHTSPASDNGKKASYLKAKPMEENDSLELKRQIAELKKELKRRDDEEEKKEGLQQEVFQKIIGQREQALAELKKCKEDLKSKVEQYNKEMSQLNTEKEKLAKRFEVYETLAVKRETELEDKVKTLKGENEELRNKLEAHLSELKQKSEGEEQKLVAAVKEAEKIEVVEDDIKTIYNSFTELIQKAQEEAGEKAEQWDPVKEKLVELWNKVEPAFKVKEVNASLAENMEKLKAEKMELEGQVQQLKAEKEGLDVKVNDLIHEVKRKADIISKVRTEVEDSVSSQRKAIAELKEMIRTDFIKPFFQQMTDKVKQNANYVKKVKKQLEHQKQQHESQIQKLLVSIRNLFPATIGFPTKASDYESAVGVLSDLPKSYKLVKTTLKPLAESLWAGMNLLCSGSVTLSGSSLPKTDANEFEEVVLKRVVDLLKQAYETQQKQRKESEGMKSELEARRDQLKRLQEEYDRVTKELQKSHGESKGNTNLKEQLANLKERLGSVTEELNRKNETLQAVRKEKLEIQEQCRKWEEKSELMAIESGLYNEKYNDAIKDVQDVKNEYERLKLELVRVKEKSRVIEEYQDKVEQLEKQLKSKQEEIETNKRAIENLTGMLEVEEAKRDWLLKTKENELLQVQDSIDKTKAKLVTLEEEAKKKAEVEKLLTEAETKLKEIRNENERAVVEKEEMKKYAESLLTKLKKKEADSTFLIDRRVITTFLVNYLNHKNSLQIRQEMLKSMSSILQFSPQDKLGLEASPVGKSGAEGKKLSDKFIDFLLEEDEDS